MFGISSSVSKANVGCVGHGGFLGGSGQSSKVDIDAGKSSTALTWYTSSGINLTATGHFLLLLLFLLLVFLLLIASFPCYDCHMNKLIIDYNYLNVWL